MLFNSSLNILYIYLKQFLKIWNLEIKIENPIKPLKIDIDASELLCHFALNFSRNKHKERSASVCFSFLDMASEQLHSWLLLLWV